MCWIPPFNTIEGESLSKKKKKTAINQHIKQLIGPNFGRWEDLRYKTNQHTPIRRKKFPNNLFPSLAENLIINFCTTLHKHHIKSRSISVHRLQHRSDSKVLIHLTKFWNKMWWFSSTAYDHTARYFGVITTQSVFKRNKLLIMCFWYISATSDTKISRQAYLCILQQRVSTVTT